MKKIAITVHGKPMSFSVKKFYPRVNLTKSELLARMQRIRDLIIAANQPDVK